MVDRNTKIRGTQIFDNTIPPSKLEALNSPVNDYLLIYDASSQKFEWVSSSGAITETPSGTVNGSNKVFTLSSAPVSGSLSLYLNGLYQEEGSGNDYVISGSTITFVDAPQVGDILVSSYDTAIGTTSGTSDKIEDSDATTSVDVSSAEEIRHTTNSQLQLTIKDGIMEPASDNDIDLGTATKRVKDAYLSGELSDGTDGASVNEILTGSLGMIIDGGGSVISTGLAGTVQIPFDCTIKEVVLAGDQSGDITIDIKKSDFSTFPSTTSIVNAGTKPNLSSSQKYSDSTLTSWTVDLNAGDMIDFVVDSVATLTRCLVSMKIIKR